MTACFTGHRPHKLPWGSDESDSRCRLVRLRLMGAVFSAYEAGCTRFISGMAQGIDLIAAEAVLELMQSCPVTLECALPYPGQAERWPHEYRLRHRAILQAASAVTAVSPEYSPGCMERRNRYMIENSRRLIAVYNGEPGGTANAIRYAQKLGLDVHIIDLTE